MSLAPSDHISTLWCHSEGLARVLYSPYAKTLYTAGNDSMLRAFALNDDGTLGESTVIDAHTDSVQCLSATNNSLLTACEDGCVRSFGLSDNEFKEFVVKSELPARWVGIEVINNKPKRVALASDTLVVKVVDYRDHNKIQMLHGHTKSVRSATWHPNGNILATSSCDGVIKIWKEKNFQFECVKTIDGLIRADDPESEYGVAAVWHPSGKMFVCTTRTHDIAIIDGEKFIKIGALTTDGHTNDVAELSWSPNGRYLASSAKDGYIIVWSIDDRRPVSKFKSDALITSISWHPKDNCLAFIDTTASVSRWTTPIPDTAPHPSEGTIIYNEKSKQQLNVDDNIEEEEMVSKELERDLDLDGLDDFAIDDEKESENEAEEDDEKEDNIVKTRSLVGTSGKGQQPFQSGSTPLRMKRRYLAFNMLGVIHVVDQDTHNLVTVEFHDKSQRRGYSFQDHFKCSLCALGSDGAVYATTKSPSVLLYKPFETWSSEQDWNLRLPDGETCQVLASGAKVLLACTSRNFVRFLTTSGIQKYVWNIGKECVTAAAGKQYACIVSRNSGGCSNGYQNLNYDIIDLNTFEVTQSGQVPLERGVSITWLGFSDDIDVPVMFDSNGLLSILDRFAVPTQARWVPLLDTNTLERRVDKEETYWPVGITNTQMICIILKGSDKYPYFPKPLLQEIDIKMPLMGLETQPGQIEEKVLRESIYLGHLRESKNNNEDEDEDDIIENEMKSNEINIDKQILQLMQTACKAQKYQRALDAVKMLHQFQSIDVALQIASYFEVASLQDRIYLLKEDKLRAKEKEDKKRRKRYQNERIFSRPLSNFNSQLSNQSQSKTPSAPSFPSRRPESRRKFEAAPSPEPEVEMESRNDNRFSNEDVIPQTQDDENEPITFDDEELEDIEVDESNDFTKKPEKRKVDEIDDNDYERLNESRRKISLHDENENIKSLPTPPSLTGLQTGSNKPTANPFAKSVNPFAKSNNLSLKSTTSIHQSDSFLERAEKEKGEKSSKSKQKKQSTLLSHISRKSQNENEVLQEQNSNDHVESNDNNNNNNGSQKLNKFRNVEL